MLKTRDSLISLKDLKKGETGTVVELNTTDRNILKKLLAMGIMPGVSVRIIQSFPSYVFESGFTQVAVDEDIASIIIIKNN